MTLPHHRTALGAHASHTTPLQTAILDALATVPWGHHIHTTDLTNHLKANGHPGASNRGVGLSLHSLAQRGHLQRIDSCVWRIPPTGLTPRRCDHCGERLPATAPSRQRWCEDRCRDAGRRARSGGDRNSEFPELGEP